MSVTVPVIGELFTVRIRKHHTEDPSTVWFNNYELYVREAATGEQLLAAKEFIMAWEAELLLQTGVIDQSTISTWVEEPGGYDPFSFITTPENIPGIRPLTGGDDMDLQVCWYVRRAVTSGRTGKVFLRNSLLTTEVATQGGKYRLANPASMNTIMVDAIATSNIDSLMASTFPIDLVMVPESGTFALGRDVINLVSAGVTLVNTNHKYFDKGETVTAAMALAAQEMGLTLREGDRIRRVRTRKGKST